MFLIHDLRSLETLTERETGLRDYILAHPEDVQGLSSRQLGEITYTSAATVTRFCQKLGCDGWPDFKLRFVSELRSGHGMESDMDVELSAQENIVTLLHKTNDSYIKALENTQKSISLNQLLRIQRLLHEHQYIDIYAYDTNAHLARYACSQLAMPGRLLQPILIRMCRS